MIEAVHPTASPILPPTAGGGGIVGADPARVRIAPAFPGSRCCRSPARPMIEHVYGRVARARGLDRVVVLTDGERIARAVEAFGGDWEMTPPECASGTGPHRLAPRGWKDRGGRSTSRGTSR